MLFFVKIFEYALKAKHMYMYIHMYMYTFLIDLKFGN